MGAAWLAVAISAAATCLAAPQIVCEAPVHKFGTVDRGQAVKHTFVLRNTGDQPLKIGKIRACCGGTAKIASKTIAPGSNTTLDVTLSLKRRRGTQKKSIYVASNDPKQPYYRLQLQGTAVAALYAEPSYVNLGNIEPGTRMHAELTVMSKADVSFDITNVVGNAAWFTVGEAVKKPASNVHPLRVRTVPPLNLGSSRGEIRIFTDHPKYRELKVNVRATVASELVVAPHEILLRESKNPAPVTRYVAVRSRGKKSFKVTGVSIPDDDIKARTTPLGTYGYRCELKNIMPFPDLDGKTVVITTDVKTCAEISIPIRVVAE